MNVSSMDMTGGLSVKDPSQSQSRLPQWTHPNPMDNLPGAAPPLDQNPSKHGTSEPVPPPAGRLQSVLVFSLTLQLFPENSFRTEYSVRGCVRPQPVCSQAS